MKIHIQIIFLIRCGDVVVLTDENYIANVAMERCKSYKLLIMAVKVSCVVFLNLSLSWKIIMDGA